MSIVDVEASYMKMRSVNFEIVAFLETLFCHGDYVVVMNKPKDWLEHTTLTAVCISTEARYLVFVAFLVEF